MTTFVLITLAGTAKAEVIINVTESAGSVVFRTTGRLNLSGATFLSSDVGFTGGFIPGGSNWYIASGTDALVDSYAMTTFDGPFGTSSHFFDHPTSTTGDHFLIWAQGGATEQIGLNLGYVSGTNISSEMVFAGATIAGFTMIPGTYHYAIPNDTITLAIGQANTVAEPTSLVLIGIGLTAVRMCRRRLLG
jgi:hypothetical protein